MECSQAAAWTTYRSLLVASRAKAISGRLTKSGSTLPRSAYMDSGVIGCLQYITSHSGITPASPDMRPTPLALFRMQAIHHLHPCPTQLTISITNYAHAQTATNSSAFHAHALALLRSFSGICGNSTTANNQHANPRPNQRR